MITFKRFECQSIYGGDYLMDNAYRIFADDVEIGQFYFPNKDNCEMELYENEMYIEYLKLNVKGYFKQFIKAVFKEFKLNKIIGETNDDNKVYWESVEANVSEQYIDEDREMYLFIVTNNGGI